MGHVILQRVLRRPAGAVLPDYVRTYTDLPFLITLDRERETAACVPGKFLTAADLGATSGDAGRGRLARPSLLDAATGDAGRAQRLDGVPLRRVGRGPVEPRPRGRRRRRCRCATATTARGRRGAAARASTAPDGTGSRAAPRRARPPRRRAPRHDRVRPDARPVRRRAAGSARASGRPGTTTSTTPYTPAWQAEITGVPAEAVHPDRPRVRHERRGVRRPLDDHHGRRHLPVVPRRRDLPGRSSRCSCSPAAWAATAAAGRTTSARRSAGRSPAGSRWPTRWTGRRPPRTMTGTVVLVHAHRPVALRRLLGRRARLAAGRGPPGRHAHRRHHRPVRAAGLDAVLPAVRRATRWTWPTRPRRPSTRARRPTPPAYVGERAGTTARCRLVDRGRRRPGELAAHAGAVAVAT